MVNNMELIEMVRRHISRIGLGRVASQCSLYGGEYERTFVVSGEAVGAVLRGESDLVEFDVKFKKTRFRTQPGTVYIVVEYPKAGLKGKDVHDVYDLDGNRLRYDDKDMTTPLKVVETMEQATKRFCL